MTVRFELHCEDLVAPFEVNEQAQRHDVQRLAEVAAIALYETLQDRRVFRPPCPACHGDHRFQACPEMAKL